MASWLTTVLKARQDRRYGGVLALAGFVVGGAHLLVAIRRWVREMEIPPSEVAKLKLAQARAAASAGADAWQNGPAAAGTRGS
jgi:hypothetical protein